MKKNLVLTAVLVQDPDDNEYTGFFEQFPQAVAEGKNEEECMQNLMVSLDTLMRFNKSDSEADVVPLIKENYGHITKKDVELNYAFN